MAGVIPAGPVPRWERSWPGRLKRELDDLDGVGAAWQIDGDAWRDGALHLDLRWIGARGAVHLRIVYPDSFPHVRPVVLLLEAPDGAPARHHGPVDGELCLLGRDGRQWQPTWTLATFLGRQLDAALSNSGEEDPQGEPVEFWWNSLAGPGSSGGTCIVDSDWSPPPGTAGGHLDVRYAVEGFKPAVLIRARVERVVAAEGGFSAEMTPSVTGPGWSMRVPWTHLDGTLTPGPRDKLGEQLHALVAGIPRMAGARAQRLGNHSQSARVWAFSYPMETGLGRQGTGWLFLLMPGKDHGRPGRKASFEVLRTLRAGATDLAVRNPAARILADKRIAVVGAGALGGPVSLELAKNGCGELHLVDADVVEPGNSIRWVAGKPAWGKGKAEGTKALIDLHWPSCRAEAHPHMIGAGTGDGVLWDDVLGRCDLVIDATASHGVTSWLGDACRTAGIPLVACMATADVDGGVVGVFRRGGGCPRCLEHAWHHGDLPPFGEASVEPSLQPPGCSERTFVGGSYDLQEISLQAVRMVLAALAGGDGSVVASLRFDDGSSGIRLPSWRLDGLRRYEACRCR